MNLIEASRANTKFDKEFKRPHWLDWAIDIRLSHGDGFVFVFWTPNSRAKVYYGEATYEDLCADDYGLKED